MTAGLDYLSRLVKDGKVEPMVDVGLTDEMFQEDEIDLYRYISKHVQDHGVMPARSTVEKETGLALSDPPEPVSYYLVDLERRHLHRQLVGGLEMARDLLKDRDPEAALRQISDVATNMTVHANRRKIFDFRKAKKPIMNAFKKRVTEGSRYGIRLGWEHLDNMTGGLREADTVAIVGRPALGKTYLITWAARNTWFNQGKIPLVISMEMDAMALMQRTLGIHAKVNTKQIRDATMSTANLGKVKKALNAVSEMDVPFWIVDGDMISTVDDVVMLARQLKPDVVFIDGGYLMGHKDDKATTWLKVKDNVESLHKRISKGMGIPTIVSYQFSKEVTKLRKGEKAGVEHIGLSDAVGQTCSHVLGLFEEETMETMERRKVTILKGREGAIGGFSVKWDFNRMDFSEYHEKTVEELTDL